MLSYKRYINFKKNALIPFVLIAVNLMGCVSVKEKNEVTKPNIVLIVVDQLSAEVMTGSSAIWVDTPTLDSLSKDAVSFKIAMLLFPCAALHGHRFLQASILLKVLIMF